MKTIPSGLLAHIEAGGMRLAWGLRLQRMDGEVFGFTSCDATVSIDGVDYISEPGLEISNLVSTAGLAVDNAEIRVLPYEPIFNKVDVVAGRWDGATFVLFRYAWSNPALGVNIVKRGHLGNFQPKRGVFVAELLSLRQILQQPVGSVVQPTCRYRLGSTSMPDGLCMVDLDDWTVTGAVDLVASSYEFIDAARTEVDDWFAEGVLTWTSGLNEGLSQKVRASTAAGVISLSLPMVQSIQAGDTYSMHAGCLKRHLEDCRDKFDNIPNFGGEPHLPGQDRLTAPASFST